MSKTKIRYISRVVLPYGVFAALWIFLSDQVLAALVVDPEWLTRIQTYKGLAFVCVTSFLLYCLVRHELVQREHAETEQMRLHDRVFGILENMTDGFVALDRDWRYRYLNQRAGQMLDRTPASLIGKNIWKEFPEGVGQNFYHAYQQVMQTQQPTTIEEYYPPWQRWFENRIYPSSEGLHIFFQEITLRKQAEAWREGHSRVLGQIVAERPLQEILDTLIHSIESQAQGALGSIMLVDDDGYHLRYGAGPSLPMALSQAINGMEIGPAAGACGTATYSRELVIIADFQTDPRGTLFRELAERLELRACWSQPVFSASGEVLGTFAMYYAEPRTPTLAECKLIEEAGHLAAVAIEAAKNRSALTASELRFRATFEQAAVGIAHVSPEGNFLRINERFCDIVGYSREEILALSFRHITHPDDLHADLVQINRMLAGEVETYSIEKRYIRKDGATIWGNLTVALVRAPNGSPDYFIPVIEDISLRKQTEALFEEQRHFLQQVLDTEPGTVYIYDLVACRNVFVNRHWLSAYGYTAEETQAMGGELQAQVVHPEDQARTELHHAAWRQALSGELRDIEYRIRHKNGEWCWLHSRETAFTRNDRGEVTQILGIAQDITQDRKLRTELELRDSLLRETGHMAKVGGWEFDPSSGAGKWTDEVARIHDMGPDEYANTQIGLNFYRGEHRQRAETAVRNAVERGEPYDLELEITTARGWRKWVRTIGHPVFEGTKVVKLHGSIQDITDRKLNEDKLRENARQLEILSRRLLAAQETERRHIARELHDEIGQLLTVVKLDLQTVLRQCNIATLTPALKESMEMIDHTVARVRDLSLDLRPSMLDDLGLVPALRWLTQRQAQRLSIAIDLELPSAMRRLPGEIETACFRIVQEAITNASRHADAKTIQVLMTLQDDTIKVVVRDDGCGFDAAVATNVGHTGGGFGLLGMKERAELAGGHLTVISQPETGTCIEAHFPSRDIQRDPSAVI